MTADLSQRYLAIGETAERLKAAKSGGYVQQPFSSPTQRPLEIALDSEIRRLASSEFQWVCHRRVRPDGQFSSCPATPKINQDRIERLAEIDEQIRLALTRFGGDEKLQDAYRARLEAERAKLLNKTEVPTHG